MIFPQLMTSHYMKVVRYIKLHSIKPATVAK